MGFVQWVGCKRIECIESHRWALEMHDVVSDMSCRMQKTYNGSDSSGLLRVPCCICTLKRRLKEWLVYKINKAFKTL